MDTSVYIGPYVVCTVKVLNSEIDECQYKKECPNPTGHSFCSKCGIQASKRYKIKEIEDPHIDCSDLFDESLTSVHIMSPPKTKIIADQKIKNYILIPNRYSRELGRSLNIDDYYERELPNLNVQSEIAWFEKTFKKEIKKLKEICLEARVTWGIKTW